MEQYKCSQELMEDIDFIRGTAETNDYTHTANS